MATDLMPMASDELTGRDVARFWSKVDKSGVEGCWLWRNALDRYGYAKFYLNGRSRLGHRIAYEALVGPIPAGLHLDHLCLTKACVNPAHLEPVTQVENMARTVRICWLVKPKRKRRSRARSASP